MIEFEEHMLYLDQYDADEAQYNNGVWLALDKAQLEK